uniref:NAD-dependent epimerase/dehydratase domain-containing protein n=1 Tax=Oryza glumipatula TaxID=40148 RepID=A0A0E0B4Q7_9ORYZ
MTPPPPPPRRPVCVTGAGGFTGSWLVKLLLSRGYAVHATLRDPVSSCAASSCMWVSLSFSWFLKQMENAPENLRLFKADVLDGGSLTAAFAGCEGVFHPATPVPEHKTVDPEKEMLAPAVKGTRNVLEACSAASVQKLVVVSSICAVCFNPSLPRDRLIDETCWSDKKSCKENENWYCLAKTEAEEMALEYSEKNGLHVITCIMYDKSGPCERLVDVGNKVELTSEKPKKLGWKPRKLEETLADSVESYKKAGLVDDEPCRLPHVYRMPDTQE